MNRERFVPAIVVAVALGVGMIALQRWVAETKFAAILLVAAWFVVVAAVSVALVRKRPDWRLPLLGTIAAVFVATVAIGYFTGFRDTKVDEDIVVAEMRASEEQRDSSLAGITSDGAPVPQDGTSATEKKPKEPTGPVELLAGGFTGADGHAGTGKATVVRDADGARTLTFTEFDVDPGAKSVVWLTTDDSSFDDRVELGDLKGNVGDQQYAIPNEADLRKYETVVIYCTPFTVRIAVAPLS